MLGKTIRDNRQHSIVDESANPAAKLLDFFDNMQDKAIRYPNARSAVLETKETVKKSTTLAELRSVEDDWMEIWMRQWQFAKPMKGET